MSAVVQWRRVSTTTVILSQLANWRENPATFTRKPQKNSQRNRYGTHSEQQWNGNRMGKWYNNPEDMRYTKMLAAYLIHLNP
jgi:hypothetical protein